MKPVLALVALLLLGAACDTGGGSTPTPAPTSAAPTSASCQNLNRNSLNQQTSPPAMTIDVTRGYKAKMTTSKGSFTLTFNPPQAPVTVNNFICLSQAHYYDGLKFHRVVPGFVAQGGDPLGTGFGGPAYKLPNETNSTPWKAGSVGMASSSQGVSGSQFFIVLADGPSAQSLATSGVYNQFAQVTDGFDVVQKLQVGDTIASIDVSQS